MILQKILPPLLFLLRSINIVLFVILTLFIAPKLLVSLSHNEALNMLKMEIKYRIDPEFREFVDYVVEACGDYTSLHTKLLCVDMLTDVNERAVSMDEGELWGLSTENIYEWDCSAVAKVQMFILKKMGITTYPVKMTGHVYLEPGSTRQGVI